MMKIEELKEKLKNGKMYLLCSLNCLCTLELINNNIHFIDNTRGIFCHVDNQNKLDNILLNYNLTK